MSTTLKRLSTMRRPRLLIRAARHGLAEYDRRRDLARIAGVTRSSAPGRALEVLIDAEAAAEESRRTGGAGYSVARHVELMIALIAEARAAQAAAG